MNYIYIIEAVEHGKYLYNADISNIKRLTTDPVQAERFYDRSDAQFVVDHILPLRFGKGVYGKVITMKCTYELIKEE